MKIINDKYERTLLDLGLFNEGGAEGGDGDQGGATQESNGDSNQSTTQGQTDKGNKEKDGDEESKFKKFKEWLSSTGADNDDSREANKKDDKKDDNKSKKGDESKDDLSEVNERIAGIERREKMADMREAGVPKNMLDDAMALFESSGSKDINKFLESRPYLKGQTKDDEKPKAKTPNEEPAKKSNLSAREKHLKKMGYIK